MAKKEVVQQHIHKLKRHSYKSGTAVYFCVLDCKFKVSTSLALGKRTLCWRCGESFIMDEYTIRLAKPHCPSCHKPKDRLAPVPSEAREAHTENEPSVTQDIPSMESPVLSLSERLKQTIQSHQANDEDI